MIPASCLSAFAEKALNYTNIYRAKHHVGPLRLDTGRIAKIAQGYSCRLASTFKFQHNTNRGANLGENLYMSMSTIPFDLNNPRNCERTYLNLSKLSFYFLYHFKINWLLSTKVYAQKSINAWLVLSYWLFFYAFGKIYIFFNRYNEVNSYDFNTGASKDGKVVGHFTA